ncbi:beta-phosphoglucomutase [Listeria booriae]|uniref:Beta-phosphoglucomutase n=1 Tax=Listeria booriae TaxID=1552123 RepID=A0A099W8K9_9LIST|nr:beta-phosphoglucomutase [Listeria booriae]KGL40420.1 beta-phosphoglucomutase [Listeria booriae]MBC1890825.1 beta-phosphoglucomutase [Listeria booriae]STY42370.1 Putative beta-phosphoglucomutase [Listeria booriae]
MEKLEGIIFDLDGVITDTAEFHYLAWKKLADKFGIEIDRDFNETLKGVSRTDSLERILAYGGRSADFDAKEKAEMAEWKNDVYKEMIEAIQPSDILPGIESFLKELKEAGIRTAIASASKNAEMILCSLGIRDQFDYVVDAAKITKSKPDPEVFLKALELLGLSAEVCIGVEDAASGVDAIKDAKMRAVGIGSIDILGRADLVLASTADLQLEQLRNIGN